MCLCVSCMNHVVEINICCHSYIVGTPIWRHTGPLKVQTSVFDLCSCEDCGSQAMNVSQYSVLTSLCVCLPVCVNQ